MAVRDEYLTLASPAESMLNINNSKFYGFASAVHNEEECKVYLADISSQHLKASHICFAYRLGLEGEITRVNDAGEPSGSAGRPMLGQIISSGLTNIIVVVVRYFGGSRLGLPGLIRAYKTATAHTLDQGNIICSYIYEYMKISVDYVQLPAVINLLKSSNVHINNEVYKEKCTLQIKVRKSIAPSFRKRMLSLGAEIL